MCPPSDSTTSSSSASSAPPPPNRAAILRRLVDAHCHPTDRHDYVFEQQKEGFGKLELGQICAMSSNLDNQKLIKQISQAYPKQIIPCYGIHPWFTHPLSFDNPTKPKLEHYSALLLNSPSTKHLDLTPLLPTLPDPVPLASFISSLRADLEAQPHAMLGEVGLDKAFRIPMPPPPDEGHEEEDVDGVKPIKVTSPLRTSVLSTPLEHQVACLKAQILLAVELRRNVSFHSVRAPEDTVRFLEMVKKEAGEEFERIHLCLHSFGASAETAKRVQQVHPNVYFSFSTAISGRSPKFYTLLRAIGPHRLLVESDYPTVDRMDAQVWDVFEAIMEAREWDEAYTVDLLEANWKAFREEGVPAPRKEKTQRGGKKERKRLENKERREKEAGEGGAVEERGGEKGEE